MPRHSCGQLFSVDVRKAKRQADEFTRALMPGGDIRAKCPKYPPAHRVQPWDIAAELVVTRPKEAPSTNADVQPYLIHMASHRPGP